MKNIIKALVMSFFWVYVVTGIYTIIGYPSYYESIENAVYYPETYVIFFTCFFAPIWEEALYRYAPITIAREINPKLVWPVVIASSCLFGWGHGESHEGVLLQGVLGLIFSWVYIKNNYSYLSSVIVHAAYNGIIYNFFGG